MAELGQIERPAAEQFSGKRKLYCIPSVYPLPDAPADYTALFERFWEEAAKHVERLEAAGRVTKIFCETISAQGEDAYGVLERLNEPAFRLVRKKIGEGAMLVPVEREEILGPFLDWTNCLHIVRTEEALRTIYGFYADIMNKRLEHARATIEQNLGEGEAGLLIMRDEDRMKLQLPPTIEIFLVTPPTYDDILRWLREKAKHLTAEQHDERDETDE